MLYMGSAPIRTFSNILPSAFLHVSQSVEYCQAAREFFAKPTSEKERYQRPPEGKGFGGWNCIGREQ